MSGTAIKCCMCGVTTEARKGGRCLDCMRGAMDVTEGIPREYTVHFCPACGKYYTSSRKWLPFERESTEFLGMLSKFLKLKKLEFAEASFIYTEPHSRRIKMKVTVRSIIFDELTVENSFTVVFIEAPLNCPECNKLTLERSFEATVQIRQKVKHPRTLLYLEQIILQRGKHHALQNVVPSVDGLDCFCSTLVDAQNFVRFLQTCVPGKIKESRQLKSQDVRNNIFHYEYTICYTVVPLCKNDLCILSKQQRNALKNIGPVVIVSRIQSAIHFVDSITGEEVIMQADNYYRNPIEAFCFSSVDLTNFLVIDNDDGYVTITRNDEVANDLFVIRSYLASKVEAGDLVQGYFMRSRDLDDFGLEESDVQDAYLVKLVKPPMQKEKPKPKMKNVSDVLEKEIDNLVEDLEDDEGTRAQIGINELDDSEAKA